MSTVVADLEAALTAAKADPTSTPAEIEAIEAAIAAQPTVVPVAPVPPVDTSGLPGGVDSAPVSEPAPVAGDPAMQPGGEQANAPVIAAPAPAQTPPLLQKIEQDAETAAVDIIGELKAGTSISNVANKLLDQDGLASIVKAIGDLAGKVF